MRGVTEQVVIEKTEEGEKDKKKKRRSHRRGSKPNSAVSVLSYGCANAVCGEASDCLENGGLINNVNNVNTSLNLPPSQGNGINIYASNDQGLSGTSVIAFSSLPSMHFCPEGVDSESMLDQCQFPPSEGTSFSRSCPVPISHEESNEAFSNETNPPIPENEIYSVMGRKYFVPHWSLEMVNEAIEKGEVFRASFRVNVHNRLEAYCTIDGVPTDVLISGVAAQNRAVEGDTVAIKLDPIALWTRLKGSAMNFNKPAPSDESSLPKLVQVADDKGKGKEKLDAEYNSNQFHTSDPSDMCSPHEHKEVSKSVQQVCALLTSFPCKRPTGRVVAIIGKSSRRDAVVGFLDVNQWLSFKEGYKKDIKKSKISNPQRLDFIQLSPNDAKFPKLLVPVRSLPDHINKRLKDSDATVETELLGAKIHDWSEENILPYAHVVHVFGQGGEIKSQVAAILFENAICSNDFSPESLSSLPDVPWEVPVEELKRRLDLRTLCTITIDPATATDLDDALSVERVSDNVFRVGVHIADASFFILPDTPLDKEAQTRSTSVYIRQHKLPMLPPLLTEGLASLNPGVDRLAFSIIFDFSLGGDVLDRWIGRTVIRSCCKLSYQHVQDIIDGLMDPGISGASESGYPKVYGHFGWQDIIKSVKSLQEISRRLKENRFKDGALLLEGSKLFFSFDEYGIPYDSTLYEQRDSDSLVEEFMLLTNRTAAEVISRAFPDCALLRRHPEPNARRLREFEAFWCKHGLELDTSSSGHLHISLQKIREKLKEDPVLFDILLSHASKPMQLASYFCTGDFKGREDKWAHYSLALPSYTHFTSPLRRYPDIVVHRTLAATVEAEDICLQKQQLLPNKGKLVAGKCFTGLHFNKGTAESKECKEVLSAVALKHRIPCTEVVAEVAAHCNERKLASKHAEDASERLYMWVLLRKKETLIAEARVLGLGPKFMSIYIHQLGIERRIYYDEVEGLTADWLEATSILVLDLCRNKRFKRRGSPIKTRPLEEVAWVVNPSELKSQELVLENGSHEGETAKKLSNIVPVNVRPINQPGSSEIIKIDPLVFPLTVRLLSTVHVALHATGGNDGPLDIGARLYMSSYFV